MPSNVPTDVVILLLRAGMVVVLYLFLFSIVRLIHRELRAASGTRRPEAGRATLVIVDPGTTSRAIGQTIQLETVTRLGRSDENTVMLDDDFVSATHAMVIYHDGRWWVRDAGSTNGTLVNGGIVTGEAALHQGDGLQVGGVRLEFRP